MSEAFLRAGVHPALVGHDLVLLDERGDAYHCLPQAAGALRLRDAEPILVEAWARPPLAARSLLSQTDDAAAIWCPPPELPTQDLEGGPRLAGGWRLAARTTLDHWRGYRGRSFAELLATVRAGPGTRSDVAAAAQVARELEAALVLAPAPAKCLARSFLLMRALQRRGVQAHWVFGVRTWPFRAHCWVQAGSTVLDEAYGRLAAYAPILAV